MVSPGSETRSQVSGSRVLAALFVFLFVSAAYLYTFPQPNVFYAGMVLLHALAGTAASIVLAGRLGRLLHKKNLLSRVGWLLLAAGAALGLFLVYTGTARAEWRWLYAHIVISLAGAGILSAEWVGRREWLASEPGKQAAEIGSATSGAKAPAQGETLSAALKALRHPKPASSAATAALAHFSIAGRSFSSASGATVRVTACLIALATLGLAAHYQRESRWSKRGQIANPPDAPATMDGEGDGPKGPFFPSSAQVYGGQKIPSKFFMESDSCKRCHQDIYNQWYSSAHHFSSFNNQWYRKSIEYMQDTIGTRPSKWCGGCHDPAVLYAGKMDTPIKQFVHSPEAQAGLGCMMCHSIAEVKSTMGQGDFYLEYPRLHELAASKNPAVRGLHDFLVKLNPEPHRRVFLKPFMRNQTAEFCSACHKVHLDVPVNHYRWIRGFNEYDNWQASGVSGEGARSFYYPAKPAQCADCHMPLTASQDAGNVNGQVHSHRFPGANTALPTANEDTAQLQLTEDFLKNKILSVDIFALSPAGAELKLGAANQAELATTFAVGEEAESKVSAAAGGEVTAVTAPLNRVQPAVRRGDTVRIDAVVRTRKIGHFFPGGTVDAYDTWLELKGTDDKGQTIFWSGMVENNGKGPVEKGAHFYRSLQIDGHGNPINKRNAWATRSVVYVHLIPPGAADTVHYRLHIPENAGNRITLHARLCYRKFAWWNTQFAFAGVTDPNQPDSAVTPDFDDRKLTFTGSLVGVSAKQKEIPDLPIVALAEDEVTLAVLPHGGAAPEPKVALRTDDWQRWNDYGIGLLLQGNLKAAQAAFEKVAEIDARNPDGWVNIGRAAVQEGDMERARSVLEKALAVSPDLARAHFFYAKVLRADGNYDGAAEHLRKVLVQYPRDRVALNDLGRILFLERKYGEAVKVLQSVLEIDPEDLQAHYDLMLCYNGLGDEKQAKEHEARYLRFKADEAAQAITGNYRRLNPEDNNERQAIHEHVSVSLVGLEMRRASGRAARAAVAPVSVGASK